MAKRARPDMTRILNAQAIATEAMNAYAEDAGIADRLPLANIANRPSGDTRPLNGIHVKALADSIAVLGLITPLTVDRKNRLLAGGHRREALQLLAQEQPKRFAELFSDGVPVRRMNLDAEIDTIDALQIEVEENTQRRNYTTAEIREAARKLEEAGYERLRGRPKEGQRSLNRELMQVFRLSRQRITEILNQAEADYRKSDKRKSLSETLTRLYQCAEHASAEIGIPATSEELQHVQQDIARLVTSLKRAIARHTDTEA